MKNLLPVPLTISTFRDPSLHVIRGLGLHKGKRTSLSTNNDSDNLI